MGGLKYTSNLGTKIKTAACSLLSGLTLFYATNTALAQPTIPNEPQSYVFDVNIKDEKQFDINFLRPFKSKSLENLSFNGTANRSDTTDTVNASLVYQHPFLNKTLSFNTAVQNQQTEHNGFNSISAGVELLDGRFFNLHTHFYQPIGPKTGSTGRTERIEERIEITRSEDEIYQYEETQPFRDVTTILDDESQLSKGWSTILSKTFFGECDLSADYFEFSDYHGNKISDIDYEAKIPVPFIGKRIPFIGGFIEKHTENFSILVLYKGEQKDLEYWIGYSTLKRTEKTNKTTPPKKHFWGASQPKTLTQHTEELTSTPTGPKRITKKTYRPEILEKIKKEEEKKKEEARKN